MRGAGYPRNRIRSAILKARIPDSYRIMPGRYLATPLGTSRADSRFGSRDSNHTVLYASPDFSTAFVETVVRDRFARLRKRNVAWKEIRDRIWARLTAQAGTVQTLLDLRGDGCIRIGAPTDVVHAKNHAAGRAFAKTILSEHPDIEGVLYVSRLTGGDVYAVFDRGIGRLVSTEVGMLMDHPELPDVLARHRIGIMR